MGRQANFLGSGAISPNPPQLGGTLHILVGEIKKQHDLEYLNLFL